MPEGPSSFCQGFRQADERRLLAEYAASQEAPAMPQTELTLTIFPRWCSFAKKGAPPAGSRERHLYVDGKDPVPLLGLQSVNRPV